MDSLESCCVCMDIFDGSLRPRVLPCGHNFCQVCLNKFISFASSTVQCPYCQEVHRAFNANDFPINYGMEALISELRNAKIGAVPKQQSGNQCGAVFSDPKQALRNQIRISEEAQFDYLQYHTFLNQTKVKHEELLNKISHLYHRNLEVVKQIDNENRKVAEIMAKGEEDRKRAWTIVNRYDSATATKANIDGEVSMHSKILEDWRKRSQKELPDPKLIRSSGKLIRETAAAMCMVSTEEDEKETDILDFSTASLSTVEKLNYVQGEPTLPFKKLLRRSEAICDSLEQGHVYAIQHMEGQLRSARVTVKDRKTYLHYLKNEGPPVYAHTVKHSELIGTLNLDSVEAFMDVSWNGSIRGRVHILLSPDTPLARHFRLLCSGDLGPTYANTRLLEVKHKGDANWEQIYGGDYQNNNGTGGAALMRGLKPVDSKYKRKSTTGIVWSRFHETDGIKIAQFGIKTGNTTSNIGDAMFGQVLDGLEILKEAAKLENIMAARIEDCGVVLPL